MDNFANLVYSVDLHFACHLANYFLLEICTVRCLSLQGNEEAADILTYALSINTNLRKLNLSDNSIQTSSIKIIAKNYRVPLRSLNCASVKIALLMKQMMS